MFDKLCNKFLPIYFQWWPLIWLAIWCAPVRYKGAGSLPACNDTAWGALRITMRAGENHQRLWFVIKSGVV